MTENGKRISVWDLKTKEQFQEINCQSQVAEFDFSVNGNYLIVRDKDGFLKIVNMKIEEDLFQYYDKFLEPLTEDDRKKVGIDW